MMFDLAVIGSGGAAFAAAIAARRKDRSVVMVERSTVGGTCVNTGCVPSKALLAAAEARHVAMEAGRFPGIRADAEDVDFAELIGGKNALVDDMRSGKYVDLAKEYGFDIVAGQARFADEVGGGPVLDVELTEGGARRVEAAHYLIATGSAPWAPPIDGLADAGYLTSTTAMELTELPGSLLVVGGNYIGLEQAQLFARLGVRVTVVEMMDHLAPNEEPEAGAAIADVFADEGIEARTAATVTEIRRADGHVVATVDGEELRFDEVLVATGRRPVTDGLNLEAVGVATGERGEVVVDAHLRTANPRVWAAGDVAGQAQFVYVAGAQGAMVADNALDGAERTLDYSPLPRVTFTSPAIAAVGLTDAQAGRQGVDCECRVLGLENVPRAIVNRDTRGLIKIVAERDSGRVLGVTVVAEGAGDVIATAVYAVQEGMTVDQVARTWCPYLTMAEGFKLAAQTFTRDVAKLSCCAS
ncbi:mercury(II) reductase [Nocardiopsis gilva YIM 90087]|uniref:Mercuric reductase n=1 Tax=Nocardiopsis gilva YIM 90087 TaxID=1235441 RepID=A0A223SCJ5_9ACTN|nr:mercury(II) reductase [Nocardiopsis gilva]ASU85868.1 mercury(II) reductase [Nocardiopsis gilva YIM 90087]